MRLQQQQVFEKARSLTVHLRKVRLTPQKDPAAVSPVKTKTPPRLAPWAIGRGRGNVMREICLPPRVGKNSLVTNGLSLLHCTICPLDIYLVIT